MGKVQGLKPLIISRAWNKSLVGWLNNKTILWIKWPLVIGIVCNVMIGLYGYIFLPYGANDLHLRWAEAGYWLHGYDPIQIANHSSPILEKYGKISPGGGYPPWSYVYALLITSPLLNFEVVKILFFILNCATIIVLALLIKSESGAQGFQDQWLFFCGVGLCCPAVLVALRHGQYGIMVTAFIWVFLFFETRGRSLWAGLFFALAMIKPQTAALFFLLPFARKSFATCFWCVLSVAAATAFAAWWCQTWPWTLLSGMLDVGLSHGYYMGIGDPLRVVIGEKALFFSSVIIFSLITFFLLIYWRWASVYQLAAIPAVFSTIWISHRTHDLLIISLLIVPIFWLAMNTEGSDLLPYAGLAGLSHWGPHFGRFYHYWYVPLPFRLLWIVALVFFLYSLLRTRKSNVSIFRL